MHAGVCAVAVVVVIVIIINNVITIVEDISFRYLEQCFQRIDRWPDAGCMAVFRWETKSELPTVCSPVACSFFAKPTTDKSSPSAARPSLALQQETLIDCSPGPTDEQQEERLNEKSNRQTYRLQQTSVFSSFPLFPCSNNCPFAYALLLSSAFSAIAQFVCSGKRH